MGAQQQQQQQHVVNLLDTKRANHMGIALGRLKVDYSSLKHAIIELDDSVLSVEQLQMLKTCLPTPEEALSLLCH